ncbi:MAG: DUF2851 family protein [bacterium]
MRKIRRLAAPAAAPDWNCQGQNFYSVLLSAFPCEVRETASRYQAGFHWTERHLQCVWFDDRLRPTRLVTSEGETVVVESPGRWNLEAGPDFIDAQLRIGADERRLIGDVEVHVRPVDWERHQHDREGLYRHVVLHVTYFAAPALSPATARGLLQLPLAEALAAMPAFSFDDVDLAAYPHAALPLTPRPCGLALRDTPERWEPLLASAGIHRLQRKAQRLQERLARLQDREQLLYEELLAALGYKHNAAAFRRLAQLLPRNAWDPQASMEHAYARLLGAAGLLPDIAAAADDESRQFVRMLWDHWWRDPLPWADSEKIGIARHATRPNNAPARRLAAAAALFYGNAQLGDALLAIPRTPPARWFRDVTTCLESRLQWDFWRSHLSPTGARQSRPTALIGKQRLASMVANVVLPLLAAEGEFPDALAKHLPPEGISAPMREAANALFSRDHNPALYATSGLYQQGLLQIHHDFCLNARTGCAHCALAGELGKRLEGPAVP